ncbi:MAG: hypothetical protein ABI461_00020 [Polyangiaceae bacterium]
MKNQKIVILMLVSALVAIAGCSHDKEQAGALLHAMEQYRAAPDELKMAKLADLTGVTCSTQELCDAKLECLKWVEPTAKGLTMKLEAQKTLANIKAGNVQPNDPNVTDLMDNLDDASRLLDEGHAELQPCEQKLTELRIKYRL